MATDPQARSKKWAGPMVGPRPLEGSEIQTSADNTVQFSGVSLEIIIGKFFERSNRKS